MIIYFAGQGNYLETFKSKPLKSNGPFGILLSFVDLTLKSGKPSKRLGNIIINKRGKRIRTK